MNPRLPLTFCFTLLLAMEAFAAGPASPANPPETTIPSIAGEIGDGIGIFLPIASGQPIDMPPSLCLLDAPRIRQPLSDAWPLRPVFSQAGGKSIVRLAAPPGTSFYGTGEVTGPLLRNGTRITLWNTDTFKYQKDNGSRLYQSHPWVLGVRPDGTAFGFLADSTWRAELDLRDGIAFISDGPLFPVIIIDRASPQEVLRGLAELTGTMPLPPKWALGYQQCRWSYSPASRVRQIADEFRTRKIPCDVIWMDIDYMDGFRVFTFNPKEFPDPKGLNEYLHGKGFKAVWMIDPGVKLDKGYAVFNSGSAADVWVQKPNGEMFVGKVWPGDSAFPDFTRPETRAWWAGLYGKFMAQGIDGVWNDMNEPSVFDGPDGTMPEDNLHRGGGSLPAGPHAEYHNVFGMLMARATREGIAAANPEKRPFVLTRANFLGGQRYAATWTGDNESTWEDLKLSIPMSLNLGLSGQPFSGPDIGGFAGTPPPGLWANWIAIGAYFPFARGHATKEAPDKEPWAFGPETEEAARTALGRRYRLLPYIYTLFNEASRDGMPVMRPLFFADAKDPALRAEEREFLLGSDLLVIPKWAINPPSPKGIWRTVSLDKNDNPGDAFQPTLKERGGAIIPLGKSIQSTAEESLDPLTLLVCLDEKGTADGRLFEDAGEGYGYRQGDDLLTTYHAETRGGKVVVSVAKTEGSRPRPSREVEVVLVTQKGIVTGKGKDGAEISLPLKMKASR